VSYSVNLEKNNIRTKRYLIIGRTGVDISKLKKKESKFTKRVFI